jgi:hypothetical protein
MPLSDIPPDAPPKRAEALRMARQKILEKAKRKFLFEFTDRSVPTGLVVENGRLVGLEISRTEVVDGRAKTIAGSAQSVKGPFVISSIGSIPEPVTGIPQQGEVYEYVDAKVGLLMDGPTAVYAAGNVLTGKGNIKDSLDNATEVGTFVAERYLGLADDGSRVALAEGARSEANRAGEAIADNLGGRPKIGTGEIAKILARVREKQKAVGFEGNYRAWIAKVTPPDLQ